MPCPPPGDLPNPGIKPRSPALQADSLPSEPAAKPKNIGVDSLSLLQGTFPTQEWNQGLLHCRRIPYQLNYREAQISRGLALLIRKERLSEAGKEEPQPLNWPPQDTCQILRLPGTGAWRASSIYFSISELRTPIPAQLSIKIVRNMPEEYG